jgi:hypothetical protein
MRGPNYGPERTKDGDGSVTTLLVLVILGVIWAAVLLPPYLQNRREHRPGDSIASFRHQLSVLERATPEGRARNVARIDSHRDWNPAPTAAVYAMPTSRRPAPRAAMAMRRSDARRRRRDVFVTLLGAVVVTFLLAIALGGLVWLLQLVTDVVLVGFTAMLVRLQQEAAEKELKVRFLEPTQLRSTDHQPLLRRVGS